MFDSPAMRRCECAGKAFEEVAEIVAREGLVDVDQICRRVDCARLCTACRPDLERYLRRYAIPGSTSKRRR